MPSDFVLTAPQAPGIYLMKNSQGTVLYVGKAKDIKKRMQQYFSGHPLDSKTSQLVSQVTKVEFIITHNETEALILESNLIKKFKGKYNVDLRDSYRYPFVQLTEEAFARIVVVREPKKNVEKEKNVFGPFVDGAARKRVIETAEKTFKLRTCNPLPKKACIKFFIGQCTAPCIGNVSKEEYGVQVEKARRFFSGERTELIESLQNEMKELSNKRLFEMALQKRDLIALLQNKQEPQEVDRFFKKDQDIIVSHKNQGSFCVMVFPFRRGTLLGKKEFVFNSPLVKEDILEDFLLQFYSLQKPPHEIILGKPVEKAQEIAQELLLRANHQVELIVNPRGANKRLLLMAQKNLAHHLNPRNDALLELKNRLLLPTIPKRMEAFDISHLGGNETSASMVSFWGGKPDKTNYRHFSVKTVQGIDDVSAIKEVLQRRFGGFLAWDTPLPELVLIDGGKPQLSAARTALESVHVLVPVVALAKRNEELFVPYQKSSICLPKTNPGLKVLMNMRDEAHRFANRLRKIKIQKKMRSA